jgi:hypothetical protein
MTVKFTSKNDGIVPIKVFFEKKKKKNYGMPISFFKD